jgi:cellulose biosynthesis protein BcsQ
MRIITLFNEHSNSTYSLNVLAQLARKGKSVLYIDLRLLKQKPVKQKVGHDISLFFSSHSKSLDYFAVQYEKNLHVVNGNSSVFEKEFSNYSSLFTFTVFESATQLTQYDYIVFEVTPTINLFALNALYVSTEVMSYVSISSTYFAYSLAYFLKNFNSLHHKKVLLTKLLLTYDKELSKKAYAQLVFDFSSSIVSFPFTLSKTNVDFKSSLNELVQNILEDELFLNGSVSQKVKFEEKHLKILDRVSLQ